MEGDHATLTGRLRALLPSLSRTGQTIGRAVLADPASVVHLTVTDLAVQTGTSVASVVRFCQDVGLRGYQDLKLRLASESRPTEPGADHEVRRGDPPDVVLKAVLRATAAAIADATATVDPAVFARAVTAIGQAAHLLVVGVGTSAPLAQDAAYRFRGIGLLAEAPPDAHVQHVSARLLRPGAVCLTISHTGQTREILLATGAARDAGATTIAITSFYRSPLTELCDLALVAGSAETHHRVEAMNSRLVHTAVIDALYVATCLEQPQRTREAQELTADAITDHRM